MPTASAVALTTADGSPGLRSAMRRVCAAPMRGASCSMPTPPRARTRRARIDRGAHRFSGKHKAFPQINDAGCRASAPRLQGAMCGSRNGRNSRRSPPPGNIQRFRLLFDQTGLGRFGGAAKPQASSARVESAGRFIEPAR